MNALSPELLRYVRIDELLENVAGSQEIACMVVDEFLVHVEPQLAEIEAALQAAELPRVARTAHRFKGSLAAVSAVEAPICAGALEKAALRREPAAALHHFAALRPQVEDVIWALRRWKELQAAATGSTGHG